MKFNSSQMRRLSLAVALVLALGAAYGIGRHQSNSQTPNHSGSRVLYYVDPMHPSYRSEKPGIAPDCGMQLEPVFVEDIKNESTVKSTRSLPAGAVSIDGSTQRLMGIRVATGWRSSARRIIREVVRVVPQDTRVFSMNSGADGFIRETFQDSVGTQV